MNVLITGVTGFIGRNTAMDLISRGYEVYGLVRASSPRKQELPAGIHIVEGSLEDLTEEYHPENAAAAAGNMGAENAAAAAGTGGADDAFPPSDEEAADEARAAAAFSAKLPDIDVCIHLAWQGAAGSGRDDRAVQQRNADLTIALIRMLEKKNCGRFIFAGSQAEYGRTFGSVKQMQEETAKQIPERPVKQIPERPVKQIPERSVKQMPERSVKQIPEGTVRQLSEGIVPPLKEGSPCSPLSEYGRAKLDVLRRAVPLCRKLGMTYIHMRIFSVYGAGDQPHSLLSLTTDSWRHGRTMNMASACGQMWNFLHVRDCAAAISALAGCPFITSEEGSPDEHVVNVAGFVTRPLSDWVARAAQIADQAGSFHEYTLGQETPDTAPYLDPDISRLIGLTGFKQKVTLKEGITEMLE